MKKVCEIENFEEFVDLNLQEKVTRIPDVIDFHQNALHLRRCALFSEDGNSNILRELKLGDSLQ